MAFMKAAGKAILNSPKAIRKKLGGQDGYRGHERKCSQLARIFPKSVVVLPGVEFQ